MPENTQKTLFEGFSNAAKKHSKNIAAAPEKAEKHSKNYKKTFPGLFFECFGTQKPPEGGRALRARPPLGGFSRPKIIKKVRGAFF